MVKTFRDATEQKTDLTKQHDFSLQDPETTEVNFVLVIGESARSDRFSLNGYNKNTNPRLSRVNNLVSFTDFHALGTSTLTAIPHIFLHERKAKSENGRKESSLIHILKHVGFKTAWFSCYKSQRQSLIYDISLEADSAAYAASLLSYNQDRLDLLPYDHALLKPLQETLGHNNGIFIVLHTKGSHTDYNKRLPTENVLHRISYDSGSSSAKNFFALDNAYDNTILYTDLFLNDVIDALKDKNAVLLYLSDHAESLGEAGVYGHNAPFETAPKEQIHIPMIWWASDKFLANPTNRERFENVRHNAKHTADQSYVFHSVLDCLGVQSDLVYTSKSLCRPLTQNRAHA